MIDICGQPFLLSLEQAKNQTNNFDSCMVSLQKHQKQFKIFLQEHIYSGEPAPNRFHFLHNANSELCYIRSMYGNYIKKTNPVFFEQWKLLINDARRHVCDGIKMLDFQRKCPAHMLSESATPLPIFTWTVNQVDLGEVLVGIHRADVVRLQDGSCPPFPLFAKNVGNAFGINFKNPSEIYERVVSRKKNQTPFLNRIIYCIKDY
jgi:hypothetical protein